MTESHAVGGLYVAVGLNAQPALAQADAFFSHMVSIQNRLNGLDLTGGMEKRMAGGLAHMQAQAKAQANVVAATQRSTQAAAQLTLQQAMAAKGAQAWGQMQARAQREMEAALTARARAAQVQANVEQQAARVAAAEKERLARLSMAQLQREIAATSRAADAQVKAAQRGLDAQVAAQQRLTQQVRNIWMTQVRDVENAYKREVAAAEKAAAQSKSAWQSAANAARTGGQELLTGLGAARSGNFFYAGAAMLRFLPALTAAFGGMSAAAATGAGAIVAVTVGVAAAVVAVGALSKALWEAGTAGAESFEMLRVQLGGMLGDAERARQEFDFLTQLGMESIIPTDALMDADRQLLAFGVTNDRVRRGIVQFASDWGTATGKTAQQIYYLNLALGQVSALGKANMIDLRQLANVGIDTAAIYQIVGKHIGKSAKEVAAGVSDGIITSDRLFAALLEYGMQFDKSADKARKTVTGLKQNIQDTFNTKIAIAFDPVNTQIGSVLESVLGFVKRLNFDQIGAAFANAITYIKGALSGVQTSGLITFFNTKLPQIINGVGVAVGIAIRYFRSLVDVIHLVGQTAYAIYQVIVDGIAWIVEGAAKGLDWLGILSDEAGQGVSDWAARTHANFEQEMKGVEVTAMETQRSIVANWTEGGPYYLELGIVVSPVQQGINMGQVPKQALDPQKQWYKDMLTRMAAADLWDNTPTGGGDKGKGAASAAKDYLARVKELIKAAADASKRLGEALTVPFAQAIRDGVTAQRGELGKVEELKSAFVQAYASGDIGTIVGQYEQQRDAIKAMFAPFTDPKVVGWRQAASKARAVMRGILSDLHADTAKVVRLAGERVGLMQQMERAETEHDEALKRIAASREQVAKQYDDAKRRIERQFDDYYVAVSATEGRLVKGALTVAKSALDAATTAYEDAKARLDDLVAARDDFLKSLRDSMRGYVNALSDVVAEVQTYTRLDALGSFSLTTSKSADLASFKQTLADRLDALRQWREQVKTLMAGGLDSALVQDLVAAGPDASRELVAALAGASAADVAEINAIQGQLAEQIAGMQTEASAAWFDAGIGQAQAYLAPIQAAYESAQARVAALEEQRALAMGVLEAWKADQDALYAQQEAEETARYEQQKAGLQAALDTNAAAASKFAQDTAAMLAKIEQQYADTGVNAMQGLIDGMSSKEKEAVANAKRLAEAIKDAYDEAMQIHSPSRVMYKSGFNTGMGLVGGLGDTGPLVKAKALDLADTVTSAMRGSDGAALAGSASNVTVVIEPRGDKLADFIDVRIEHQTNTEVMYASSGSRL